MSAAPQSPFRPRASLGSGEADKPFFRVSFAST